MSQPKQIKIEEVAGGFVVSYVDSGGKKQKVMKPNQKQAQLFAERVAREK